MLIYLALLLGAGWLHLSGMNNSGRLRDLWSLPLTGTIGFLLVHSVASVIDRHDGRLRRLLLFIGDNTLYVFVFHIVSFKLISLLKIWWYGLDYAQIGCHMVIHYANHSDLFWLLYTVAGVSVPLIGLRAARALRRAILPAGFSRASA